MRRLMTLASAAAIFTGLAMAEDFNGKLLDSACFQESKGAKPCDATGATKAFLLDVGGKAYRLDNEGNAKAATAIKSRADRGGAPGPINAKVSGEMKGDTIAVQAVDVQ